MLQPEVKRNLAPTKYRILYIVSQSIEYFADPSKVTYLETYMFFRVNFLFNTKYKHLRNLIYRKKRAQTIAIVALWTLKNRDDIGVLYYPENGPTMPFSLFSLSFVPNK